MWTDIRRDLRRWHGVDWICALFISLVYGGYFGWVIYTVAAHLHP